MRRVALRRPRLRRASPARRLHASLLCVGFALSLIAGRLVQLQGLEGAAFSKQAAKYKLQVIQIPAERGSITTADGTILAMTVQEDKVIAQFDRESTALFATARLFDDGLIDPRDSRKVLAFCLSICREAELRPLKPNSFGVARM